MSRVETLGSLWQAWAAQGEALTAEQWAASTRLAPWDVRALFAHASAWPRWLSYIVTQERDTPPTHASAAALLRDFNLPDGAANLSRQTTADKAVADAGKYTTAEMIASYTEVGPRALSAAHDLGNVVVNYLGMANLHLDEALSIGILEATVHMLDLQRALELPPSVPADGLALTTAVLTEVADPVAFIEAATGRTTDPVFPVLT
ncbi:maleylpyruvate isomerase N-terminal domain-containing protein [Actinoplanes sp. Pm04-4]|uniref:Maleylpyruvate isomerase N-terminal domain-containing protein n=1 Tax=Paractinoplanes pyxinae TaxID=2997416 RepID=A0ABT4BD49_9ACTN|nr:maleylpyruvate isomerase N-terminal domain-containing protein [Actinoplanes pyxinae]MCY1143520.1 maleylpyruvate isomerase N-terminal domain-containing protein [Actinoplanes pyxinae]